MTPDQVHQDNHEHDRSRRGPKTVGGKARSSQNALRHGLSLPIAADPYFAPEIERLAQKIAGARTDLLEIAREVAQAQFDLVRIAQERHRLLAQNEATKFEVHDAAFLDEPNQLPQLLALDRYDRRALSRRKFAIRRFDEARLAAE